MIANVVVFAIATFLLILDQNEAWMLCKNEGKTKERSLYLHASRNPDVSVDTVNTQSRQDILDLADLRYHEWMQGEGIDEKKPSLGAFRMATAEIVQERAQEGAKTFLARIQPKIPFPKNEPKVQTITVVGSAELSPIELKGLTPASHLPTNRRWLYVTDVVTSTTHRRLGIGTNLMDAMQIEATSQFNATRLYLHVHPENIGAMEFYVKRGFQKTTASSQEIDEAKLAEAAGARGQILLQKELIIGGNDDVEQIHRRNIRNKHRRRDCNKGFAKTKETKT